MTIKKCKTTGKTRFPTKKLADRTKMRIWSRDPQADIRDLHSYLCPDCGFWHVGHASYYKKVLAKQNASSVQETKA